ncbi:cytochrome C oxidase subunit IV family protein [Balneatrix alpica]|uniref:cytochrome C oxidase subunit IV family protein n=1 Tax=Balneatrix alpica TaxID=75684 RepID=UPI002739B24C|nr:cytochrome C oxidase subunit IV family protein [Balneatrix alpica]
MSALLSGGHRLTLLWAILLLLTLSAALLSPPQRPMIAAAILTLSMLKAALVVDHFMQLRQAPGWLRLLLQAYCPSIALAAWLLLYA